MPYQYSTGTWAMSATALSAANAPLGSGAQAVAYSSSTVPERRTGQIRVCVCVYTCVCCLCMLFDIGKASRGLFSSSQGSVGRAARTRLVTTTARTSSCPRQMRCYPPSTASVCWQPQARLQTVIALSAAGTQCAAVAVRTQSLFAGSAVRKGGAWGGALARPLQSDAKVLPTEK